MKIDLSCFKGREKCFVFPRGNAARNVRKQDCPYYEASITSVGRKYLTIDFQGREYQIDKDTGSSKGDCNSGFAAFYNEQSAKHHVRRTDLIREVESRMRNIRLNDLVTFDIELLNDLLIKIEK